MAASTPDASFYADFSGLAALKRDARSGGEDALHAAAQQFEGLFTQMMLKSMREASFGDSLVNSSATELYQGMFDQQLSTQLSKGKGLGLADMLTEQLKRQGALTQSANKLASSARSSAYAATGALSSGSSGSADRSVAATDATEVSAAETTAARTAFVQKLLPYAQKASQALGVDATSLIAQAALETGWGQSLPQNASGSSNNLFGIKSTARWQGPTASAQTIEYENGSAAPQTAKFKAYASAEDCFDDYVTLLGNPRYAEACNTGGNVAQFASALQQGGYATDPLYAQKLQAVASSVSKLVGEMKTQAPSRSADSASGEL